MESKKEKLFLKRKNTYEEMPEDEIEKAEEFHKLFGIEYYLVFRFINKSKECVYFANEKERDDAYNNLIKEN